MTNAFIPVGRPDLTESEIEAVVRVLKRGWLTRGEETLAFEEAFRRYTGAEYALAVSSCTAALHLALLVHGVGAGDEVILPSLTFASTGHVVVHCGAVPVFAEVDPVTYCLDPNRVEALVTERTKAVIAVHFAGHPAETPRLLRLVGAHGVPLVEDAAHALGAAYPAAVHDSSQKESIRVGAAGSTACFSFYTNKNLTTGEGGMLTLPAEEMNARARLLSLHGMDGDAWRRHGAGKSWRYDVTEFGYKYNTTDLASALGRAQLVRLDDMQARRKAIWDRYQEGLAGCSRVVRPVELPEYEHARHLYAIRLADECPVDRDEFVERLRERGIGATVHYRPLHLHAAYRKRFGTREGDLPVTEGLAARLVSLPLHSGMTEEEVGRVTEGVLSVAGE